MSSAMTRSNFSAVNVVKNVGARVLAGNSFNVTANAATTGIGNGNSTIPGAQTGTGTSDSTAASSGIAGGASSTSTVKPNEAGAVSGGPFVAALVALVVAVVVL